MRGQDGTCFLCGKKEPEEYAFCDCDPPRTPTCEVCENQLHLCQDCGVEYCGKCFHKDEHNLCTARTGPPPPLGGVNEPG